MARARSSDGHRAIARSLDLIMQIHINGDSLELPGPMTLTALLTTLHIDPRRVAIEHNGSIVKRDRYDSSMVQAGDQIEVVNFVGGGCFPRTGPWFQIHSSSLIEHSARA